MPALARWVNHSVGAPGGTGTVNVAPPTRGLLGFTHAASYRQLVDLAQPNRSLYIGSLGQSGSLFGDHVKDQQALWAHGDSLPMSTDPADWGRVSVLTLE